MKTDYDDAMRRFKESRLYYILHELYESSFDNDIYNVAAQLAYYFLFSLFPLLFFFVTLSAYFNSVQLVQEIILRLSRIHAMPKEVLSLINHQLMVLTHHRPSLLSLSLLVSIWGASRGIDALRIGINRAYRVKETRSYVRVQITAILFLLAATLLTLTGFAAVLLGGKIGIWLALKLGIKKTVFVWLRWPIGALMIILLTDLSYFALPNIKLKFSLLNAGSLIGTALWLLVTWGFTKYVEHFGSYSVTYGAIGSVIILMTWFYLSGLALLIGGEINAFVWRSKKAQLNNS